MLVSCSKACVFVCVVLLVHDDHGHPLVHCQNHPGFVLFEFCKGPFAGGVEVALFVVLFLNSFEDPVYI